MWANSIRSRRVSPVELRAASFCGMLLSYRRCILVEDYIVCGRTQKGVDESVPWSCVLLSCTLISFTYGLLAIE